MCRQDFRISWTCDGVKPGTKDRMGFDELAMELERSSRGAGGPTSTYLKTPKKRLINV